jgi:hypothetical protein
MLAEFEAAEIWDITKRKRRKRRFQFSSTRSSALRVEEQSSIAHIEPPPNA